MKDRNHIQRLPPKMWSPTHIQVTVQRAKGLLIKGKNGTNNCFVTIGVGKEKYQTSVKEKAEPNVNWNEECELKIPDQGNRAELVLTCLHRNNLGIDEFLGQVTLPLNEMDVYDRPRSKWFKLESKPGKEKKNKERGELEVRISFIVKSGSLTDLSKKDKHKSSIGQLATSVGGSLLSIGTIEKRKSIKKFAKSLGSKMHLQSKKKSKDSDDNSISGSFASIDTPNSSNGGSRRYGQRAGEADPGVISEDEDEFVFDNLSHKSSGSSLNIRSTGLQLPAQQHYLPKNPSPLLGLNGKVAGKQQPHSRDYNLVNEEELEELENDFSVRAHTLPPPSKPPRTQQANERTDKQDLNEWEKKLYGKHLDISTSDSLKRRSWETARVPLTSHEEEVKKEEMSFEDDNSKNNDDVEKEVVSLTKETIEMEDKSESSSKSCVAEEHKVSEPIKDISSQSVEAATPFKQLDSPEIKSNAFTELNASFAKFEQQSEAKIPHLDTEKKDDVQTFINTEAQKIESPLPAPRMGREKQDELKLHEEVKNQKEENKKSEDENLKTKEKCLREQEAKKQEELRLQEEQKKRDAKRLSEDQRILNFSKRTISMEESDEGFITPPLQQSPKERTVVDKKEKRFNKFRYFNKRGKNDEDGSSSPSPKSNERIIIGHEKVTEPIERRSEITAALAKKYDGKTREELMLIANGMENEALLQRQRVKELEDYLDNLLLRVMETHPKILQNPYSRTTSAKSG